MCMRLVEEVPSGGWCVLKRCRLTDLSDLVCDACKVYRWVAAGRLIVFGSSCKKIRTLCRI